MAMDGVSSGEKRASTVTRALFGMTLDELRELVVGLGQPKYRAVQLNEALYRQLAGTFEEMTVLPIALREALIAGGYCVGRPEMVQTATSVDGTERYLMRMADGETVETVWMPEGDGGERGDGSEAAAEESDEVDVIEVAGEGAGSSAALSLRQAQGQDDRVFAGVGKPKKRVQDVGVLERNGYRRATICISSQVGCAVNCQFCLTAKLGIKRNLTAGEIAGQVAAVVARHGVTVGKDRINLVFMGMGEPFLNYDAFMGSVRLLSGGMGLPESRMTVSTSGILPGIEAFAKEPVRPKLALSLNASNDVVREQVMPITRKWNIAALLAAVSAIPMGKREYVTFEYVLLGGVNDQPVHAREVLALLKGMKAKVNLIVWNPGPGIAYVQPTSEDVAVFQKMLIDGGIPTYIRRPRGRDIYAACGQLKRTVADEAGLVTIGATV
ncbi:23S rRNA (adenine(2503)-C(2))-methyltransferase RlmN [Granulicella arctica]|uniref:Probable dual-specificity RNA methyltransferase RlmN n=1 Tax=Granulicella arctica TaxID=940613 RepID=A0A7Y9PJD8_9BACT|nr:23S rRNA (adenine(2503)-C(2))-methyltransferase RlmN [Granulicella arctica]NYF80849.1 23S rRNA (adenine2503-C2)-methyltransferase [Granulicella arctica]